MREWTKAIEDAKECIRLAPEFLKGYYRLATAQTEMKDFSGALRVIESGLKMDAKHPPLLKLRTTVERQQKLAAAGSEAVSNNSGPATSLQLDEATQKELEDLQEQYTRTVREHGTVQAQVVAAQRHAKMAELTRNELKDVADDTKCYRSVGKVFLRTWDNKAQVMDYLDKQTADHGKEESELMQKMEYLERRIKSQRQNIEELIYNASAATKVSE